MFQYVVLVAILVVEQNQVIAAPPGLRLTIDCGSQEKIASRGLPRTKSSESSRNSENLDFNNICNFIQNSLPKTVKDGRFILRDSEPDQIGYDTDPIAVGIAPPKSFIPKLEKRFRLPKIKVPKLYVPKLTTYDKPAPRIGTPMKIHHVFRPEEVSSAERMEKIKKAVQKLLHVVKVLGRIDEYISERMKIIVEKIAQTFE